jgi:hypothetical protein
MYAVDLLGMHDHRSRTDRRRSRRNVCCFSAGVCDAAVMKEDVARIIGCIKEQTCKHLVARKVYGDNSSLKGTQIVFLERDIRYTIYWSGDPTFLSFWVRRPIHGRQSVTSFTDDGLDGSVDFGLAGQANDPKSKYFRSESFAPGAARGAEHRLYWQRQYNEAVAAAKRVLLDNR